MSALGGTADKSVAPAFVCFWTKADKDRFWPGTVCPLMTQCGRAALLHELIAPTTRIYTRRTLQVSSVTAD